MLKQIQHQSQLPELALSASALQWLETYHWPGNIRELRNRIERGCVMAEGEFIEADDLGALDDLPKQRDDQLEHTPPFENTLRESRSQAELKAINQAIKLCNGNKTAAAKHLGISRASLYIRLKQAP